MKIQAGELLSGGAKDAKALSDSAHRHGTAKRLGARARRDETRATRQDETASDATRRVDSLRALAEAVYGRHARPAMAGSWSWSWGGPFALLQRCAQSSAAPLTVLPISTRMQRSPTKSAS